MFTTTYVETDLVTVVSTFSSFIPAPTTTQVLVATATVPNCQWSNLETPCGNYCCQGGETCVNGQCIASGGGSSAFYSTLYTITTTSEVAAPFGATSNTVITVTATGLATTTESYIAPVGTNGSSLIGTQQESSSSGLSGGAIAGIVIGVIAGIILLLLICACCCFKGLIDGLLAIFGLGPRARRRRTVEETIIEERHSRRGSSGGGRRTWFGTRPVRVKRKSGSGIGAWARVGAALATLAVVLGLKRSRDRRDEEKSSYGSSYYYDSEYTSSSE
jgi:hypothetical protein